MIHLDAGGERAVIEPGAHAGTRQEPGRPAHSPAERQGLSQPIDPPPGLAALEGCVGLSLETVVLEHRAAHGPTDGTGGTEVLGPFRVIAPPEQGPREIDTTVRLDERRAGLDGHRQRTTRMLDRLVPVVALGRGIGLQMAIERPIDMAMAAHGVGHCGHPGRGAGEVARHQAAAGRLRREQEVPAMQTGLPRPCQPILDRLEAWLLAAVHRMVQGHGARPEDIDHGRDVWRMGPGREPLDDLPGLGRVAPPQKVNDQIAAEQDGQVVVVGLIQEDQGALRPGGQNGMLGLTMQQCPHGPVGAQLDGLGRNSGWRSRSPSSSAIQRSAGLRSRHSKKKVSMIPAQAEYRPTTSSLVLNWK